LGTFPVYFSSLTKSIKSERKMNKKLHTPTLIVILLGATLACNLPFLSVPTPESPATRIADPNPTQSPLPTEAPGDPTAAPSPVAAGISITVGNVSFVIPDGLATSATHEIIPRAEGQDTAPWDIAPEHIVFSLENYALKDKFHQPQIFIYPAQAYAALSNGAAENLKRLEALASGLGMDVNKDTLPFVPFFNASSIFATQSMPIQFQNGAGYRMLTQYAQAFYPVNNHDLFYHFQGLTGDGKYYLIAILPVTAPSLAPDGDPKTTPPADGIPFDFNANNPTAYFDAITQKLNGTAPEAFTPSLSALDALVKSIRVAP
jgi:hypothetical protein